MEKAQELLYIWLKEVGEVSYERINQTCIYLNTKFGCCLDKPIYQIFYPLLYNGVVDISGNGKFCVTPECVISKGENNHIIINSKINEFSLCSGGVGIQVSKSNEISYYRNRYEFNLELVLMKMPTIESCVLSYQEVYNVKISDFFKTKGLSKKKTDSQRWYFLNPQNEKYYVIPHQSINPDAINIATCYGRIIDSVCNGIYDMTSKELRMDMYHIPILIYRVLMIESLFYGKRPYLDNGYYVFNNISRKACLELNRIFCKSIKTN